MCRTLSWVIFTMERYRFAGRKGEEFPVRRTEMFKVPESQLNDPEVKRCISIRTTNVDRIKKRIELALSKLFGVEMTL